MARRIIKALWGDLQGKELGKFLLLALGFFFLIGSFWPLKTLKESIFINLVGPLHLPEVKLASLALFFPLILLYSKFVDIFSKEKMIYLLIGIYSSIGFILVYFLNHPTIGLANQAVGPSRLIGWAFYLFVESYISLMVSLYWSFINDVTTPESAQRGYGLIIFGTQFGGFLFTLLGNYLSYDTTQYANRVPLIAFISICMFLMIAVVVFILKHVVGDEHLSGYQTEKPQIQTVEKVGFLDGLKVLITRPYVMGIFGLIFFQELITTIMGFQMSLLVKATYQDPGAVNKFLFEFALAIQSIACLFGFFGTSLFQRTFGITFCLIAFPLLLGVSLITYMIHPALTTIFYVMLIAKALNYALYQPAKEVLYIPTSKNIKYKSKAWIDMFGLRFAKAAGSGINRFVGPIVSLTGGISLVFILVWVGLASIIGKIFKKTTDKNTLIE